MAFDPDAYLASEPAFDPDSYLAEQTTAIETPEGTAVETVQAQPASIGQLMDSNPNIKMYQDLIARNQGDVRTVGALTEAMNKEIQSTTKMHSLRQENPELANMIEGMSNAERSLVGIGRGVADIQRGFGFGGDEQSTEALDQLQQFTPGGSATRTIGQMAPFAAAAPLAFAAAPSGALSTALTASGLGGLEGYTSAVGEGVDPTARTAIGLTAPLAIGGALKAATAGGRKIVDSLADRAQLRLTLDSAAPNEVIDAVETIAKSGAPDANQQVKQLLTGLDPKGSRSLNAVKKAANSENPAEDALALIGERRVAGSEDAAAGFIPESASNKLKADPVARTVMKSGIPEGQVQSIKTATPQTKLANKRILNKYRAGLTNDRIRTDDSAAAQVGKSLEDRLRYVEGVNSKAGKEVGRVAKSLKGKERVTLDTPLSKFMDDAEGMGIEIVSKKGKPALDFSNSKLQGLTDAQKPMVMAFNRLLSGGRSGATRSFDAYDAHQLKGWLDNIIKPQKGTPANDEVQRAIIGLRKGVNEELRSAFPAYKSANQKFSETIGPINEIKRLGGAKSDLSGEFAPEKLGLLARKMTSNVASRDQVKSASKKLEDVANKYGGKFNDSISEQQQFLNTLEKKFGAQSSTSLQGQMEAANEASGLVGDAARGSMDPYGAAVNLGSKLFKKGSKENPKDILDAIEELLK